MKRQTFFEERTPPSLYEESEVSELEELEELELPENPFLGATSSTLSLG